MQDVCKYVGTLKNRIKKATKPGSLSLSEYHNGKLKPLHGPVLPLIQLLSVLPPKRLVKGCTIVCAISCKYVSEKVAWLNTTLQERLVHCVQDTMAVLTQMLF